MLNNHGHTELTTNKNRRTAFVQAARRVLAVALTASLFSVGLMNQAHAQRISNGLDPTFNGDGIVITDFSNQPNSIGSYDAASDVVIQPDGKIVVVGVTAIYGSYFSVARYNKNGGLDKTFHSDGKQTIEFPRGSSAAVAVALQPDGKIVVAGSQSTTHGSDFALARLNRAGSLDRTFGTGGKVVTDFGDYDSASDVAVQADGKIVVAGFQHVNPGQSFTGIKFALARYNSDGSLDRTFGIGGKLTDGLGAAATARALVIQADGKIVVAGDSYRNDPNNPDYPYRSDFALARYNSDGSPDTTFGSGGHQITEFLSGASDSISSTLAGIALQPDGKIVAAGNSGDGVVLARYNSDGSLDTTFDGDGMQTNSFNHSGAVGVAILPDGKIVVAGINPSRQAIISFHDYNFMLARYNSDGSPDTTLDGDGQLTTNLFCSSEGGSYDIANAIAVQPDRKVVVVGIVGTYGSGVKFFDFAVARYPVDATSSTAGLLALKVPHRFINDTFTNPTVVGGTSLTGRVELCSRTLSDVVVTLDDNLASVTVPPSVTIRAGGSIEFFPIKTTLVNDIEIGTLTASLGAVKKSVPMKVRPIWLSSLTLSSDHVQGSRGVTGTLTLERRAPAGGITVTLSSSDPATAYPTQSRITISHGSIRSSFTIRTNEVPYSRSVLIRATANGATKSALLTIQ